MNHSSGHRSGGSFTLRVHQSWAGFCPLQAGRCRSGTGIRVPIRNRSTSCAAPFCSVLPPLTCIVIPFTLMQFFPATRQGSTHSESRIPQQMPLVRNWEQGAGSPTGSGITPAGYLQPAHAGAGQRFTRNSL